MPLDRAILFLAVDVLGLMIGAASSSAHDNTIGMTLLDRVAAQSDTIQTALVDQGFKSTVVIHGASHSIDVQIIERNPADKAFAPQPKRCVVEQTYGILA